MWPIISEVEKNRGRQGNEKFITFASLFSYNVLEKSYYTVEKSELIER